MSEEKRDMELALGFVENSLSEEERQEVLARMHNDLSFKEMVEDVKGIHQAVRISVMEKQLEELKKVDEEMGDVQSIVDTSTNNPSLKIEANVDQSAIKVGRRRFISRLSVAASVLILVGVGMWMWKPWIGEGEKYAIANAGHVVDQVTVMSGNEKQFYHFAMEDYNIKNYKDALKKFEQNELTNIPDNYLIYYGVVLFKTGKYSEAKIIFENYLKGTGRQKEDAVKYIELIDGIKD